MPGWKRREKIAAASRQLVVVEPIVTALMEMAVLPDGSLLEEPPPGADLRIGVRMEAASAATEAMDARHQRFLAQPALTVKVLRRAVPAAVVMTRGKPKVLMLVSLQRRLAAN